MRFLIYNNINNLLTNLSMKKYFDVFLTFLKLGLTSFGGPVAHIAYFRKEFVEQKKWLSEHQFAQLLALCQFIPGPASSQLGFCIGLLRAGGLGAILAFIAFTMPSVILLILFVANLPLLDGNLGKAAIHGLKLVACVVVTDAVLGMSKNLCSDIPRKAIALVALVILLIATSASIHLVVVLLAAVVGGILLHDIPVIKVQDQLSISYGRKVGVVFLSLFTLLLIFIPYFASGNADVISVASVFYQAGALVFGGGHVVLPLLQESVVASGWVTSEQFLSGYGVSQAIPGPMFAFSAYLGAVMSEAGNILPMALTALIFMFLPGFLLVLGVLPLWRSASHNPIAGKAIAGVNAAVVGLLAAALYDPVFISSITSIVDAIIALIGFVLLRLGRFSALIVVAWCVVASLVANMLMLS
jgi:chromate transporter